MSNLSPLERDVLTMLLDGSDKNLYLLREQFQNMEISSRKMTGVGFFTEFTIPPTFPRLPGRPSFKLGDVNATANDLEFGLGFVLYVANGALSMLEGYTYGEPWPNRIAGLKLTYNTGGNRNWTELADVLRGKDCRTPG
jgi:hypothetical protein